MVMLRREYESHDVEVFISKHQYENWNNILCDNCFGYEKQFYLYVEEKQYSANSIMGLVEQLQEDGIAHGMAILNGCAIYIDELVAMDIFVHDCKAQWHSETIMASVLDESYSWIKEDIPF